MVTEIKTPAVLVNRLFLQESDLAQTWIQAISRVLS